MYLDFIVLFFEYFRTLSKRVFIFEWIIPFLISIGVFISIRINNSENCFLNYRENIISLFGVLIGFSITIITLLLTANGENIKKLQEKLTDYKIGKRQLSLYELMIMNFSYSIAMEVIVIIINLFFLAFNSYLQLSFATKLILFSINAMLVGHILLLNLRNICDLYFSLVTNSEEKK